MVAHAQGQSAHIDVNTRSKEHIVWYLLAYGLYYELVIIEQYVVNLWPREPSLWSPGNRSPDAPTTIVVSEFKLWVAKCKSEGDNNTRAQRPIALTRKVLYRRAVILPSSFPVQIRSPKRVIEVSMEQHRNVEGRGNGRSPRKPADLRHRPARFPHAEIRNASSGVDVSTSDDARSAKQKTAAVCRAGRERALAGPAEQDHLSFSGHFTSDATDSADEQQRYSSHVTSRGDTARTRLQRSRRRQMKPGLSQDSMPSIHGPTSNLVTKEWSGAKTFGRFFTSAFLRADEGEAR
ncbi:hypothetical protein PR048_021742 [Dryococelus australis]|uniref:Uncharacterized protein n=1 Tax=Dryococelus australis TaxID=614101 RepID=A0ABQ9GZ13_9NEOP|nr:hypothetical protein PR048_021742 [Dryococelus australis]